MGTKVSIGLGQNILFDILVQNLEQLSSVYGKEVAASIQSNCANLIYILTKSTSTVKTISELAGKRTVNVTTENGNFNNIDHGSLNDQRMAQNLFEVDELTEFKDEEMLVFRSTDRRDDKKGHRIVSKPIYTVGGLAMLYRYMLLKDTFDDTMTMADIPVDTPHKNLNLKKIALNFDELMENQYEIIHVTDGEGYNYNGSSVFQGTVMPDILFGSQMLRDRVFMVSMQDDFAELISGYAANEVVRNQLIQQAHTHQFNNEEHNSYQWVKRQLGAAAVHKFREQIKSQQVTLANISVDVGVEWM